MDRPMQIRRNINSNSSSKMYFQRYLLSNRCGLCGNSIIIINNNIIINVNSINSTGNNKPGTST